MKKVKIPQNNVANIKIKTEKSIDIFGFILYNYLGLFSIFGRKMKKHTRKKTGRGGKKESSTFNNGSVTIENGCMTIDPRCKEIAVALESFSYKNLSAYVNLQEILAAKIPSIDKITAHKASEGISPKDLGAFQQGLIAVIPLHELRALSLQKGGVIIKKTK